MIKGNRVWRATCVGLTAVLLFLAVGRAALSPQAKTMTTGILQTQAGTIPATGGEILSASFESDGMLSRPTVNAKGAVLIEAETGEVIFGHNRDAVLSMASTTKIMTALVAIEAMPLDTLITVTEASVGVEGSSVYLSAGERLTLEDLLYALLLSSANDAAETIAIAVAGDIPAFAALMNQKALDLGLTHTQFQNPHGLDAEGHHTTAKELALLTAAALQNPDLLRICSTKRHTIPRGNDGGVRLLINHNKLLASYDGCIGVKTGFTKKTGRCLVSAAERDGVRLIAVTLGAPDDWRDHTALLNYGFSLYTSVTLCEPGFYHAPMPVVSGDCDYVMVENTDPLTCTLPRRHGRVICVVERPRFDFAPIDREDLLGRLCFYEVMEDGERRFLGEVPLTAAYTVRAVTYPQTIKERLRALFD